MPAQLRARIARRAAAACALLTIALAACAALLQARSAASARSVAAAHRPIEVQERGYTSSNECRSCHPREYATWAGSYHRSMTQLATPQTVMGQFDGVVLGEAPVYALGRSERSYHVDFAPQPGAAAERHPITLVTGSHHMQIYWYETGRDRNLGQLPFAYLRDDQRWVPRNAIFIEPPTPLQPAADGRWNASCIACHTTLGQPRIDAQGVFDTHVAEFGIACEACHGPGEEHIARNRSPLARYGRHLGRAGDEAIVQPKKLSHDRGSYVCGQCHATSLFTSPTTMRDWNEHGPAFRPGGDLPSSTWLLQPSRAREDPRVADVMARDPTYVESQFWSDGVMRVSGREFNGLVDSRCYQRGELACTSCHRMHQAADDPRPAAEWRSDQLEVAMDSDRACTQCHAEFVSDLQKHTQHAPQSSGSRCYNCHMPYTSYGLLKALRSHRIDVPSVGATLNAGRPNACNLCHLDKSLGWTARALQDRFGVASPPLLGDSADVPLALLLGLTGDAGQRALIAWALGWPLAQRADFAKPLLGELLDDPYDAVRYIAERSLRSLGTDTRALGYDFVPRPDARPAFAPRLATDVSAEQRALFARLLSARDLHPMRLLE